MKRYYYTDSGMEESDGALGEYCRVEDVLPALKAATEALEVLRRGHGPEVSALCFPALNLCREVIRAEVPDA